MNTAKKAISIFLVLLLLLLLPRISVASTLGVQLENDFPFGYDDDYTHGTRLEWRSGGGWRCAVQQQMYTPTNLRPAEPVPGRHQYAGYLAFCVGWDDRGRPGWHSDMELQLGVLGPSSKAEETQKLIHKWLGCRYPAGWDYQLHDEAEVSLSCWRGYDLTVFRHGNWSVSVDPEIGGVVGTYQDFIGSRAEVRAGYGPKSTRFGHEMVVRDGANAPKWSFFAVGGAEGRFWMRNALLDGNLGYVHGPETTTEKKRWTGLLKAGLRAGCGGFGLDLLWIRPSREFRTQESPSSYGCLVASWSF